ncbi:MAG: YitT family protein [Clostridiales bacterium]|nr:YitT family protein [Clostridiales bacterium]
MQAAEESKKKAFQREAPVQNGWRKQDSAKEFLWINMGIFLVALGIHVFRNPNKFASGGVSGLSLLLSYYVPAWPIGSIMLILNLAILGLGYILLGKESGGKSLYGTFALSGMIWLLEVILPCTAPLTNAKFLELIYSVFIPGVGGALVFHNGGSTGGTDIVAQILQKFVHIRLGYALMVTDFIIALGAGLLFGVEACLFSILGVCLKSFLLEAVLENLRIYKIMVIISEKSKIIYRYICDDLRRGATIHMARGAYTVGDKEVITTVLSRRQALQLRQFIKKEDPAAFITVSNSTEIIGNGFRGFE